MIIDFHTHAFPDKIVEKAMRTLVHNAGNTIPFTDGTADGIVSYMDGHGVDKAVVLNIATNPKQQHNVNDFAAAINGERLIAFGSVHPDAPDAVEELHRIRELGLKGVKLHPDYQGFFVDEDKMLPIYETIEKLGLILVFHAGVDIQYFEPVHCPPARLARILPVFGSGRVVAAHMGGYLQWYEVEEHLVGKNLYLDTSFAYSRMPSPHAARIIRNHGPARILFGSDMPWSAPHLEKRFIQSLGLSEKEERDILGDNAAALLEL